MGLTFFFNSPNATSHLSEFILHPGDGTRSQQSALVAGFMFLQIFGGHFGMPLILLTTVLSKKVQRNPMLVNFCVCWFIYATSYTLVLYAGKQTGPEPPIELCVMQAAFVYGSPVLCARYIPLLPLADIHTKQDFNGRLYLSLQTAKGVLSRAAGGWRFMLLLGSPYILFLIFTVAMVVVGASNEDTVSRSRYLFYCTINLPVVNVTPATSGLIMLVVILLEVLTGIELYRRQKALKNMARVQQDGPPLHLFVRVGIFSLYSVLSLASCIGFWSKTGDDFPYIVQASLPTAAFVIFGTQQDFLRAWGIIAVARFISRPFRRRSTSKQSSAIPVALPTSDLKRQDTVDSLPTTISEKDSEKVLEIV
ncbi:hypothetical protein K438DRAFT_1762793 [Mycena galopus ATCC 62051]|nr:hypothetical protein K438DRAFT_1762793 [Mycena galopus ATCC 62051]